MSEASGEGSQSVISGYGKGKALEKRVCMNCLRKGVKCEWDEGGCKISYILLLVDIYAQRISLYFI